MDGEIERAARLAAHLPGVEIAPWYGTPALKVGGKGFARLREPGVLVLLCPLETKEHLLETAPDIFYETDHYKGWPALLARMDAIDDDTLKNRLEVAWLQKAQPKLAKEFEKTCAPDPSRGQHDVGGSEG